MVNWLKESIFAPGSKSEGKLQKSGRKIGGKSADRIIKEYNRSTGASQGRPGKGNKAMRWLFGHPDTHDNGIRWLLGDNAFRKCALYDTTDPRACPLPTLDERRADAEGSVLDGLMASMGQYATWGLYAAVGLGLVVVVSGRKKKKAAPKRVVRAA